MYEEEDDGQLERVCWYAPLYRSRSTLWTLLLRISKPFREVCCCQLGIITLFSTGRVFVALLYLVSLRKEKEEK